MESKHCDFLKTLSLASGAMALSGSLAGCKAKVNENRDWRIFADFGTYLMQLLKQTNKFKYLYNEKKIPLIRRINFSYESK
jgi:hypothetical protein